MAQGGKSPNPRNYDPSRPLSEQIPIPKLSLEDRLALAKFQKKNLNIVGKIWNAPNTALGLAYGGLGYLAGKGMGTDPHISVGGNAIQFTNNPFGGVGAITLGNTTTYSKKLPPDHVQDGATIEEHERQHTLQGELLGPLYLPSNILGGLVGLATERDWHGRRNWNEVGPSMNPPRPWLRPGW